MGLCVAGRFPSIPEAEMVSYDDHVVGFSGESDMSWIEHRHFKTLEYNIIWEG